MKNLSNHIISLLRHYGSVGVPGIGVFGLSYNPASLDKEKNLFLPPSYKVSFTQADVLDSEGLLRSYMRKEQISENKARILLSNDLETLKRNLDKYDYVKLPGIGIISSDADMLSFSPEEQLLFYLPTLSLKEEKDTNADEEVDMVESVIASNESNAANYHYHNPAYYYIPIHKNLAKFAASLILVLIVGVAALIPMGTDKNVSSTASILPMEMKNESKSQAMRENCEQKPASKAPLAAAAVDTVAPVDPVVAEIQVPAQATAAEDPEDRYFAVVAAFKSDKEANKYLEQKSDYDLKIVMKSKIRLITVDSSSEKTDLESRMASIRESFPDAWIYTKPL